MPVTGLPKGVDDHIVDMKSDIRRLQNRAAKSDPWHTVGFGAGNPLFKNSWNNYDGITTFSRARYRLDRDGFVVIDGLVVNPTSTAVTTIFTLPAAYTPGWQRIFNQWANNAIARVDVDQSGNVTVMGYMSGASAAFVSLQGMRFYPEPFRTDNT